MDIQSVHGASFDVSEIEQAWARIGKTVDGQIARRWLVSQVFQVERADSPESALREMAARRMLAKELIGKLDADIPSHDRANDTDFREPGGRGGIPYGQRGSRRRG